MHVKEMMEAMDPLVKLAAVVVEVRLRITQIEILVMVIHKD